MIWRSCNAARWRGSTSPSTLATSLTKSQPASSLHRETLTSFSNGLESTLHISRCISKHETHLAMSANCGQSGCLSYIAMRDQGPGRPQANPWLPKRLCLPVSLHVLIVKIVACMHS
eukprot:3991762-Amphidinium_carterae.3